VSGEHRLQSIERTDRKLFIGICSCGWRSRELSTAGMAGSAHTRHADSASTTDDENS